MLKKIDLSDLWKRIAPKYFDFFHGKTLTHSVESTSCSCHPQLEGSPRKISKPLGLFAAAPQKNREKRKFPEAHVTGLAHGFLLVRFGTCHCTVLAGVLPKSSRVSVFFPRFEISAVYFCGL